MAWSRRTFPVEPGATLRAAAPRLKWGRSRFTGTLMCPSVPEHLLGKSCVFPQRPQAGGATDGDDRSDIESASACHPLCASFVRRASS